VGFPPPKEADERSLVVKKEESAVLSCLGALLLLFIIIVGDAIGQGLAVSILWRWFTVPLFGLPELTLWQAIGVSLVVSAAMSENGNLDLNVETDPLTEALKAVGIIVLRPLLLLGVGWVVRALAF
jgi:hypothetical protein